MASLAELRTSLGSGPSYFVAPTVPPSPRIWACGKLIELPPGHPVYSRIDTVCVAVSYCQLGAQVLVIAGVPSAACYAPLAPAGYITVAHVYVPSATHMIYWNNIYQGEHT